MPVFFLVPPCLGISTEHDNNSISIWLKSMVKVKAEQPGSSIITKGTLTALAMCYIIQQEAFCIESKLCNADRV